MAASSTAIRHGTNEAWKRYQRELVRLMYDVSKFYKTDMIGANQGKAARYAIDMKEDLKSGGEELSINMIGLLTGGPIVRSQAVRNNMSGVDLFNFRVKTRVMKKGLQDEGDDANQTTDHDILEAFTQLLSGWYARGLDERILYRAAGTLGSLPGSSATTPMNYITLSPTNQLHIDWDGNGGASGTYSLHSTRQMYAGNVSSAGNLNSTHHLTLDDIYRMVLRASIMASASFNRLIPPLMLDGEPTFLVFIHPWALYRLQTSTSDRFYDISKSIIQGGSKDSPILKGSAGVWQMGDYRVVIHSSQNLPRFSAGDTANYTQFSTAGQGVGVCLLMGAGAVCMANGKITEGDYRFKLAREKDEFDGITKVVAKTNLGIARPRFPSVTDGATYVDHAVIRLDHFMTEVA